MPAQVHPDSLRAVMRRVPAAVTIVTASADGTARGMTVGSFTSVSLEPVLVSFNVGKNSATHGVISTAECIVVHLLRQDQAHYSEHFARPDFTFEQQFGGVPHRLLEDGTPVLTDTLAYIRTRKVAEYDAGDHSLIVAEVIEIEHQDDGEPLLYYNTHYRGVGEISDPEPGSVPITSGSSPKAPGA